jgi:hypothetical protein
MRAYRLSLLLVCFSLLAHAQTILEAPGLAAFGNAPTVGGGGGGGGGAFTFIRSASQVGTGGHTSVTMDTTGATCLFALVTGGGLSHPTLTDNKGNTWSTDIDWNNSHISLFSCLVPSSVGTSHTISINNINNCNIIFVAFSATAI